MDRWRIFGAEAQTGVERSIEVNARDEAGAREAARMLGMLVARVQRLGEPTGPVLDYRVPGARNTTGVVEMAKVAEPPAPDVPYAGIVSAAAAVTRMARVVRAAGVAGFGLAGIALLWAAVAMADPGWREGVPWLLMTTIVAGGGAVALTGMAAAMRLAGEVGLAARDVAVRSRGRSGEADRVVPLPGPRVDG